ncbi:MAG: PD-(D/E)XK nuclease family protein, partial [Eubacteriales bacterium]|nr:PD-(D/E)XK nuclease family protein [Eubacteriales bacterium]
LKEQKFVMCVNYNEVVDSSITDKVLIQGIIDLAIIKPDKIVLIDYKDSNKSPADIKNTYQKQISLYELALKKQFKNTPITKLILSLKTNQIIEM